MGECAGGTGAVSPPGEAQGMLTRDGSGHTGENTRDLSLWNSANPPAPPHPAPVRVWSIALGRGLDLLKSGGRS